MSDRPIVKIVLEKGASAPSYQSKGASGADIKAYLPDGPVSIMPGEFKTIPTGVRMEIPFGYEVQVRARSGLASRYGITVLNSPGTIDSDYRGEVKIILINHSKNEFIVNNGDRIAQLVIARTIQASFEDAETLSSTLRGEGGFGSTGI